MAATPVLSVELLILGCERTLEILSSAFPYKAIHYPASDMNQVASLYLVIRDNSHITSSGQ